MTGIFWPKNRKNNDFLVQNASQTGDLSDFHFFVTENVKNLPYKPSEKSLFFLTVFIVKHENDRFWGTFMSLFDGFEMAFSGKTCVNVDQIRVFDPFYGPET